MVHAVLFDLDGTLIDTEKYYRIFWPKAIEAMGYHMTDEQFLAMRSLGRPFALKQLQAWYGQDFDYAAAKEKRSQLMNPYMKEHGIQVKPGAVKLLEYLKEQHIPAAVATATDPERTRTYLGSLGLLSYFSEIISATMVKEGKPSPDVYLYACEKLGENPKDCMAVEDSPNGVLSAWRAGCQVVMVPDLTEPDQALLEKLYAKVDTLAEIIPLLR